MGYRLSRFVVNETMDGDFILPRDKRKVIRGTVRFPDGSPAADVVVKFFAVLPGDDPPESTCNLQVMGHALTDSSGHFVLGPLSPGIDIVMKIFYAEGAGLYS